MTYRAREPFLAFRYDPSVPCRFITITSGSVITLQSYVHPSGLVSVPYQRRDRFGVHEGHRGASRGGGSQSGELSPGGRPGRPPFPACGIRSPARDGAGAPQTFVVRDDTVLHPCRTAKSTLGSCSSALRTGFGGGGWRWASRGCDCEGIAVSCSAGGRTPYTLLSPCSECSIGWVGWELQQRARPWGNLSFWVTPRNIPPTPVRRREKNYWRSSKTACDRARFSNRDPARDPAFLGLP
jgi:hypothetical protein